MPRSTQSLQAVSAPNDWPCFSPSKRFVERVVKVMQMEIMTDYLHSAGRGVDAVTLAVTVVLLNRACLVPVEVTETHVLSGLWLALKYSEHPACADALTEWLCTKKRAYSTAQRTAVISAVSHTGISLWKRMGMRVLVSDTEVGAVLEYLSNHLEDLGVKDRCDTLPAMWEAMRKWMGVSTRGRHVSLPSY